MTRVRYALMAILLFACSSSLHAEYGYAGMKIGPGIGVIYGADAHYEAPAPIMSLNAFLTIKLWDYLALQPELAYEMKGYQALTYDGVPIKRFHYVSLLLLFKGFFDVEDFKLQPYAGAEVAFLQEAEELTGSFSADVSRYYSWLDVGVVAGFEVFFPLPVEQLYITGDVRGEIGVLNFDSTGFFPPAGSSQDRIYLDKKNLVFYALVGMAYQF